MRSHFTGTVETQTLAWLSLQALIDEIDNFYFPSNRALTWSKFDLLM
jgi:hypothetical protein